MSNQTGGRSSTKKSRRKIGRGGSRVKAVTGTPASHPAGSPIVSSISAANEGQGTNAPIPSDKPLASETGSVSSPPMPAGQQGSQEELDAGIPRDKPLVPETGVVPSPPIPVGAQENQQQFGDASPLGSPEELAAVAIASEAASPPTVTQAASGYDDQDDMKTNVTARTAKRRSTAVALQNSLNKLEEMASGTARSPMSTIIGRTFANNKRTTLTIVAGAAAFAIVSFIIFLAVSRLLSNSREFCLTEDCVRHTTLLTQYLDSTRDPCNNFRDYVCSAWHSSSDYSEQVTSVMDSLRFSWYKDFRDILLQGSLKIPAGRKPLAMYDMCTTGYKSGASQLTPFLEFLKRGDLTWPEPPLDLFEPLSLIVYFAYRWQSPFWISVSILEPTSSGKRRILVSPGLFLPMVRKQHRSARLTYVKYWELFLVHLYPDAATRPPINVTDIENVRDVEGDILESIYSIISSGKMQPALFPFGELRKHVRKASVSVWLEAFQLGLSIEPDLTLQDYLVVSDMALIRALAELLVKYTTRQLNRHLIWLLVQHHSPLAGYDFLKIHYGSERKAEKYLVAYCAHRVEASYKVLVLALGFHSLFTVQDIRTIDTGFDTLVRAAIEKIDSSKWMDKESKVRATRKLTAVKKALWPPAPALDKDELERIHAKFPEKVDTFFRYWALASIATMRVNWTREYMEAFRLRWSTLPDYVGYDYVLNSVELAIAVATPPAYYRNGTKAMLYGGLLFLMAMQLVRAVDTEGVRWTPNGTAIGTILTESTYTKFLDKASCNNGAGNSSVFPDIPALDITYSALMTSHLLEETEALPLSQDLPADKVFFMTVCYLTCAKSSGQDPIAADCNKLVQSSEYFAEAFKCPKGSKMNPEKKCSFFT
ncbi:endothelin-converting enzyme 1-like [Amblyomma americanum]